MQRAVRCAASCGLRGRSSRRRQLRACAKASVEGAPAAVFCCIWTHGDVAFLRWRSRVLLAQVGAAFSLRSRQLQTTAAPAPSASAAWKVAADDGDDELMNEDELLTEEDLLRPAKAADDCEVRLSGVRSVAEVACCAAKKPRPPATADGASLCAGGRIRPQGVRELYVRPRGGQGHHRRWRRRR